MRFLAAALVVAALVPAAACATHDPYCPMDPVYCVETCGGAPFIQCGGCPDGSVLADACPDAGSTD